MWVSVQCCQLHWYVLPPRCVPSAIDLIIRVRLRTFVSPTLLSSPFVAQNSASVGGKIEQACWIFNTRRCPVGLPQPSGLISTANTVAQRLTPNRARSCSLSHCPRCLCLAGFFPRRLTTSGQWFSPSNAALHCSKRVQRSVEQSGGEKQQQLSHGAL